VTPEKAGKAGKIARSANCDSSAQEVTVMRKATLGTMVLFGLAGLALGAPASVKDIALPGGQVRFDASVNAVRTVPAGNPLPGLHVDAKVNGHETDIYIAPADFASRYGVKVAKGDYVRIVGTAQAGDVDTILAREISTGLYDAAHNIFRPTLTIFLRNDEGPLWVETTKPID
jgi:hypothetical protein